MHLSVRNVMLGLGWAALGAGCVSGSRIRADGEVIAAEIARADQKLNAKRCAPRELALAEANLEFAYAEVSEGDSARAQEHIRIADENAKKAVFLSKDCAAKTVLIKKDDKVVVKIEPTDRDGDGVLDADDECPDQVGPKENRGCPWGDRDKDGLVDPEDQCPEVPGPKENRGCPLIKDTDGDGVPDDLDRCPLDPEDKDGFQDEDGCPDPDNDNDGITDRLDACPNDAGPLENRGCPSRDRDGDGVPDHLDACLDVPGAANADPAQNGCPRKLSLVVVKKDRIEIKQQINFRSGRAIIKGAKSFEILNQVIQVLKDYPGIKKVRVEGHTDSVGGAASNLKLSQQRADAVVKYLIDRGIEPSRITAMGYGLTKPIRSNATEKGRAANRRTEFNILERE
jgi:outer membrane protein OmpA-like peptidoglycan-associated protein